MLELELVPKSLGKDVSRVILVFMAIELLLESMRESCIFLKRISDGGFIIWPV